MNCKSIILTVVAILILSPTMHGETARIVTEIGSIPDQLTIRLASKPEVLFHPDANGQYSFSPARQDFVLILPEANDQFIYSPRIIPAGTADADTMYIIPPTFREYTVIVDNQTSLSFRFIADRAIISEALGTAKKDYQLKIIPGKEIDEILIAAMAEGHPAVVRRVKFLQNQRRGYLKIIPADLGIAVAVQAPQEETAPPQPEQEMPPAPVEETMPEPIIEIEKPAPIRQETDKVVQAQKPTTEEPQIEEPVMEEDKPLTSKPEPAKIISALTAADQNVMSLFFNNRLIVKNSSDLIVSLSGEYIRFSSPAMSYGGGSLGVHNLRLFEQNFDLFAHAAKSSLLEGYYYEGSLIWNPAPFVAMDISWLGATAEAWKRDFFLTRTSFGLSGNYLMGGSFGQFGVGARFRLDFGNFDYFVENAVESGVRYLPSFYVLTLFNMQKSNLAFLLGVVNESIYFSVDYKMQNGVGLTYTWKSRSQEDELLSPLEQSQQHRLNLHYSFALIDR